MVSREWEGEIRAPLDFTGSGLHLAVAGAMERLRPFPRPRRRLGAERLPAERLPAERLMRGARIGIVHIQLMAAAA
jgi:hypothetical protein